MMTTSHHSNQIELDLSEIILLQTALEDRINKLIKMDINKETPKEWSEWHKKEIKKCTDLIKRLESELQENNQ